MILTLSISDFVYHITVLLTLMQLPGLLDTIVRFMVGVSIYFSTVWPSAIAFLVYRSSRQTAFIDTEKYFKVSVLLVTLLAIILTEARDLLRPINNTAALVLTTSFMFLSFLFTLYCYASCIRVLENFAKTMFKVPKNLKTKNLYIYSLMQLVTICPFTTYLFVNGLTGFDNPIIMSTTLVLMNLTGAINVWVYFVLRKMPKKDGAVNRDQVATDAAKSLETSLLADKRPSEEDIL